MTTQSPSWNLFGLKNGFWYGLLVVLLFGYIYGKDRAIRDNHHDAAVQNQQTLSRS